MSTTTQCPACGGAVEQLDDPNLGYRLEHRITIGEVVVSLANEHVAREVATLVPAAAKVLLAGILLGTQGASDDPFLTIQDVRDCAEAAARCDGVSRELRARRKFDEAAEYAVMAKRHRKCAIRIAQLLSPAEQQLVHQQIHGGPLQAPPRSPIEVVKS